MLPFHVVATKRIFPVDGRIMMWDGRIMVWDGRIMMWDGRIMMWDGRIMMWDGRIMVWDGIIMVWDGRIVWGMHHEFVLQRSHQCRVGVRMSEGEGGLLFGCGSRENALGEPSVKGVSAQGCTGHGPYPSLRKGALRNESD